MSGRIKLEEEVFKGKKLESIGLLAGGIAHDFNNLLSIIMGNLALAREHIPPGTAANFLKKAEDVSAKAAELATKFITFSPGGWLSSKPVSLSRLLDNMKASGLPGAKKNVFYDIDLPGDLKTVRGDEEQLNQAMQSIFLNAVEAVPDEGGVITIRAENTTLGTQNKFLLKKGEYVKISTGDNGEGIPAEIMEKIFDPYFSTKDKTYQKGLGLGLTLCYTIVKKHDGHIDVESSPEIGNGIGSGTTVTLYLPVCD
jgi:signal transduction histidine kinase